MLDTRKRAEFSDLLLTVTALGRSHRRTRTCTPARKPIPCQDGQLQDRCHATGAYARAAISETVAPMGFGSVLGAVIGGLLVGIVPSAVLKLGLGVILIVSAWRTFRHSQQPAVQTAGAPAT
jgi:predicted lipid-binding transport protein (Tim44 family)